MKTRLQALTLTLVLLPAVLLGDYWQQQVNYDLDVALNDTLNQVSGHETITYINHSPDTLTFIWMHLWPNAYKNNQTPLARQKFNSLSTRMYFMPDSALGWIDLQTVRSGSDSIVWQYRSPDSLDVAKFILNSPLAPADTLLLDLDFTVKVPAVLSRMGHFGQHYELTQWYPKPAVYDSKGWHPMSYLDIGEFYSEWGNYRVSITVPQNYRVAATGVLQDSAEVSWRDSLARIGNSYLDSFKMDPQPKLPGLKARTTAHLTSSPELKTITFQQDNVHDFAWFADKRFMVLRDSVVLGSGRSVQTWSFVLPKDLKNFRYANRYAGDAVRYFSDWFMEYPYEQVTVVDGDFSAGGGMEYPTITLINNSGFQPMLEITIIHEVGHNWFYGLSGSNERDYPWMDEGLNSYAENRYWQAKYPDDNMFSFQATPPVYSRYLRYLLPGIDKAATEDLQYLLVAQTQTDQAPDLPSEAFSRTNYGAMVYKKAALATGILHAYLGDALMEQIWHSYFEQWAYKHPQPEDIRQVFETVSGEDLSWYFDDLLGSNGKIDYCLDGYHTAPLGKAYATTVKVSNNGDIAPPLPIGLEGPTPEQQRITWVRVTGLHDTFQIKTDFPVTRVTLDPELQLPDMNRRNNHSGLNLHLRLLQFDFNTRGDYPVLVVPYLWYDTVDRIQPGVILTHSNLLAGDMDWYLRTFYGPVSTQLGISAHVAKTTYPAAGKRLKLTARFERSWYYNLTGTTASLRTRDPMRAANHSEWSLSLLNRHLAATSFIQHGDTIAYLNPLIWETGYFTNATISYQRSIRSTLWNRDIEFKALLGTVGSDRFVQKVQAAYTYQRQISARYSVTLTTFGGLSNNQLPSQDRFYLSTDMDPSFDKFLIPAGTDQWYLPGHFLQFQTPYTLPGYSYDPDTGITPSTSGILGGKIQATMGTIGLLAGGGLIRDAADQSFQGIGSLSALIDLKVFKLCYTPVTWDQNALKTDFKRFRIGVDISSRTITIGS